MTIAQAIADRLGAGSVLRADDDITAYTSDWRGRYSGPAACVALPCSTTEVGDIVRLCAEHRVPVLAQGGNTSLSGGAVPSPRGPPLVVISLQRMRRIRSVDTANNSITVDAGCVLADIQAAAADAGRLYPVSLGAEGSCTIGGTLATNAGGTAVLRYGNSRDNVLGLEVVLSNGLIWDGLSTLRKNNSGYNLKDLFIGSEGTLGVITAAVLKLSPRADARVTAWLAVAEPEDALTLFDRFQSRCSPQLSAFELLNGAQVDLVLKQVPGRRHPLSQPAEWHVLVELADADDVARLGDAMEDLLSNALEMGLVTDAVIAGSEAHRAAFWEFRHSTSEANKKGGVGLTSDTAVPVSSVPAFIAEATAAVRAIIPDLPILLVSHIGDGNVHFIPFFTFGRWDGLSDKEATAARIRAAVNDAAARMRGTFSAEHGIGRTLLNEMTRYKPPIELELMRAIKHAFDPSGLLNPGSLLPLGPAFTGGADKLPIDDEKGE